MISRGKQIVAASVLTVGLVLALSASASASGANGPSWSDYTRPAKYGAIHEPGHAIEMRDGVRLRANVDRPDAAGKFPVLVIQTPYNKDGAVNIALGGSSDWFVARGYAVVTVDVRGTGNSEGSWDSFGPKEQKDGPEVVKWAAHQSWSDGKVGLFGPSYMAITQILTAAQRPPHLKAIFPIVPMADGYRDIVFSGGQLNVSFIPLWMGLVTAGGLTPPTGAPSDPGALLDLLTGSLQALVGHAEGVAEFDLPTILSAATSGDVAFDGPFWKTRSPLEQVDKIDVPAFVVGGHHDLFQRGEPLIYERLKHNVPTRLLMGPWTHIGGSSGEGLPRDGVPALNEIALRWFDRYLLGKRKATRVSRIPKVTQFVYGREHYRTQADWPDPRLDPKRMFLKGEGKLGSKAGDAAAPQTFTQNPLTGICTQSTSQWTAGATEQLPCTTDDRVNEAFGSAVYTTAPMKRTMQLSGPIMARIWATTTASDAVISVRVTDVAPNGQSKELTGGWLAGSFRDVDPAKSRIVDGHMLQPWHPFTRSSVEPVAAGEPIELPVEVFPARAAILKGHRLRVVVGPGDFPHQVPPLAQLSGSLGGQVSILTEPGHRSAVELPTIGKGCGKCKPLPTPDLTR